MTALLLGLTGCGSDAGAAVRPAEVPKPSVAPVKSPLAGLAVLPRGYIADPKSAPGPFTATSFLAEHSADPALDRALLLNAGFVEGYRASRLSPDKKQRYVVQLFKAATPAKAKTLQEGRWYQTARKHPFRVPGALSDTQSGYDGSHGRNEAVAEASFVVGSLVAELSVHGSAPLGTDVRPDTALITALAAQQQARLTSKSG